jgi:manganese-dependent inorganic pyrophosphatase
MENKKIFVIGHKSPDTDSVCSAIAWAEYLCSTGYEACASVTGDINDETRFVLEKFSYPVPQILKDAAGTALVLVDHNEFSQSIDGIEQAKIIEVIDHHKVNFAWNEPIIFICEPLGSTATIVARRLLAESEFKMPPNLAGILLSAILSDTVVFKSPTSTPIDRQIAETLAKIAGIQNITEFGIEIKKQKASIANLSASQVIHSDFKEFETADPLPQGSEARPLGGKKFAVSQIEMVDLSEADSRRQELLDELNLETKKSDYLFAILMVTDIINEGSQLLATGDTAIIEKAFGIKLENGSVYIKGMMSRKKDLLPPLMEALK